MSGSQLNWHTVRLRCLAQPTPSVRVLCTCGGGDKVAGARLLPRRGQLSPTSSQHLRVTDEGCIIFGKGGCQSFISQDVLFSPRRGFILAGLLLRSAALSSALSCSLSISVFSLHPPPTPLYFSLRRCLLLAAFPPFDKLLRFCVTKHTRGGSRAGKKGKIRNHTVKVL